MVDIVVVIEDLTSLNGYNVDWHKDTNTNNINKEYYLLLSNENFYMRLYLVYARTNRCVAETHVD